MTAAELREARLRLGLTQQQVAEMMGIAQPHISNHETGAEKPGAEMLMRYQTLYTQARELYARP